MFSGACSPWDPDRSAADESTLFERLQSLPEDECANICADDVLTDIVGSLKTSMARDIVSIIGEQVMYAGDILAQPLATIFSATLRLGFVPDCF